MSSKYLDIAIIVEPRKHKNLKIVVKNILDNLVDVKVQIFHGNLNKDFILSELSEMMDKIILSNLEVDNLTVYEYSDLLLTKQFWENVQGERMLLFQTDSCICNYSDSILEECQKYGYVGATVRLHREYPWQNGGFSFRRKSNMIKAVNKIKKGQKFFPEDRFFSRDNPDVVNPAHINLSNRFSVEKYYYEKPFGQHKCWEYQSEEDLNLLIEKYPIIKLLF